MGILSGGHADENRNGEERIEYCGKRNQVAQVLLQTVHAAFMAACAALRSSFTALKAGRSPSILRYGLIGGIDSSMSVPKACFVARETSGRCPQAGQSA